MALRTNQSSLLWFLVGGAAGAALRNAIAAAMALCLSLVLVPDPEVALLQAAHALAGDGDWRLRLPFAAIAIGVARASQPVFTTGFRGWIRSLAFSGLSHRRAVAVAALLPLSFLVILLAGSFVLVPAPRRDGLRALGALIVIVGAVAATVPIRRRVVGVGLGLAAMVAGVMGGRTGLAAGVGAVLAWDRLGGPLDPPIMERHWSSGARWIMARLTARVLGWHALGAAVAGVVVVGIAALFRRNNELTPEAATAAVRVMGGMGAVVATAMIGDRLARARPPWPWSRSLPWSAWTRTGRDAAACGVLALPTLAAAAVVDWRSAAPVAMTLPAIAFLAAGQVPRAAGRHLVVSGWLVPVGGAVATVVGLWPAFVWLMIPVAGAAWWDATRTDRRVVATRWEPLHYSTSGDSNVTTDR